MLACVVVLTFHTYPLIVDGVQHCIVAGLYFSVSTFFIDSAVVLAFYLCYCLKVNKIEAHLTVLEAILKILHNSAITIYCAYMHLQRSSTIIA